MRAPKKLAPVGVSSWARTMVAPIPRVTLTREEAAASFGMSLDSFERHVQPDLRIIRLGDLRLVPVAELERWADQVAEKVLA